MRNLLTYAEVKDALRKCFAASWSIAIVDAGPPLPPAPGIGLVLSVWVGLYGDRNVEEEYINQRTRRPNDIIRRHSIQDLLRVRRTLHLVQTRDQHVHFALTAFAQSQDIILVLGVADHAGDVPGAVEEQRRQVAGDFAVAAQYKNLHVGRDEECREDTCKEKELTSVSLSSGFVVLH